MRCRAFCKHSKNVVCRSECLSFAGLWRRCFRHGWVLQAPNYVPPCCTTWLMPGFFDGYISSLLSLNYIIIINIIIIIIIIRIIIITIATAMFWFSWMYHNFFRGESVGCHYISAKFQKNISCQQNKANTSVLGTFSELYGC